MGNITLAITSCLPFEKKSVLKIYSLKTLKNSTTSLCWVLSSGRQATLTIELEILTYWVVCRRQTGTVFERFPISIFMISKRCHVVKYLFSRWYGNANTVLNTNKRREYYVIILLVYVYQILLLWNSIYCYISLFLETHISKTHMLFSIITNYFYLQNLWLYCFC